MCTHTEMRKILFTLMPVFSETGEWEFCFLQVTDVFFHWALGSAVVPTRASASYPV